MKFCKILQVGRFSIFQSGIEKNDDDGDGKKNGKKYYVYINKQQLCTCITLFLYISLPSLHRYDMKLPNFTSPLYGVGEHNTKIVAFFS